MKLPTMLMQSIKIKTSQWSRLKITMKRRESSTMLHSAEFVQDPMEFVTMTVHLVMVKKRSIVVLWDQMGIVPTAVAIGLNIQTQI